MGCPKDVALTTVSHGEGKVEQAGEEMGSGKLRKNLFSQIMASFETNGKITV